ncbi:pyridoxal phosphate-dependent aminotransferase [Streptoalloteichus hindustanus]|uniref:Aminotransferase n=1 Tax=Streptoalloteichus hindustanus TaxID=2017 RepID=A0A1M5NDA8_STRHI|nr:pyridoxal phosphate-dependent aminotransferase [Streptoalloteichus hindustanus]SHG87596.1 Aspartate/methionine/tyrosine aminotransferase [Streptoalloteichus hindustanus]
MTSSPRSTATLDRPELSSAELVALTSVPDAEQRLVQYVDLLREKGIEPPTNLSVAENVLLYPEHLKPYVFRNLPAVPERSIKYAPPMGSEALRKRMATLFRDSFDITVDHRNIYATCGVSSALECIALALREGGVLRAGDAVMLPAPCWQGFRWSFQQRPELHCVGVDLLEAGAERFELTLEDIKREYRNDKHRPPKLLVLTNPHNPLGVNYDEDLLEEIYRWVLDETDMHVISDEIYRHSQVEDAHPDFVSAFALRAYRDASKEKRARVHLVWGFAKDFGLSGFRLGFVVSTSPLVRRAMQGSDRPADEWKSLSWFSPFDSLKQHLFGHLLKAKIGDEDFATRAMADYRGLLTAAYREVVGALREQGIPHVHRQNGNPGVFCWLDLRDHLPDSSRVNGSSLAADPVFGGEYGYWVDEPEQQLAKDIADNARVLLLPGRTLFCHWPGYFRLCYTAEETSKVCDAVERVGEYLRSRS